MLRFPAMKGAWKLLVFVDAGVRFGRLDFAFTMSAIPAGRGPDEC